MSINFENQPALPLLRERLRDTSDAELVRYGKAAKGLCKDARCPFSIFRMIFPFLRRF
jgi:hypothetical protein